MSAGWTNEDGTVALYCGDCLEVLPLDCDAVVTDPPYNIGKASWDKVPNYLEWCESWIAAASSGLKRQGAFWCFHSEPDVLVELSRMIAKHGRQRQNWVTWDKYNETGTHSLKGFLDGFTLVSSLRRFQDFSEYIVYHADDGQWTKQSDECRGFIFEPLRAYLEGERNRAGFVSTKAVDSEWQKMRGTKGCMAGHWFGRSQWDLPTAENYGWLRRLFNAQGGDYLRREYDDLRREYEHLRPTFNNPGKVSSVWQFPPAKANGHVTPKPVDLMRRIIETTTNPGDTVLDCFMGSGTTGVACVNTGRRFIGIEKDADYFELAKRRLSEAVGPLTNERKDEDDNDKTETSRRPERIRFGALQPESNHARGAGVASSV